MFFPDKQIDSNTTVAYPSILLNGNRFHNDQPATELLAEFLMVINAPKKINFGDVAINEMFPEKALLSDFKEMTYSIEHRLYFKLFSLWTSGKHPKASESHASEYKVLLKDLCARFDEEMNPERHLEIISYLYQGFQIAGDTRDWSSRSFLPLSKNLITGETIWRASNAMKKGEVSDFAVAKNFFTHNDRDFYARGGEVLYLQLLACFTKSKEDVERMLKEKSFLSGIKVNTNEMDPAILKATIEKGLFAMYSSNNIPSGFDSFISLVEDIGQPDITQKKEKFNFTEEQSIGYIPEETWYLGYLFALDLFRLFQSQFDAIDLLRLLQLECMLHTFRTMIFTASSYLEKDVPKMAIVSSSCESTELKTVSRRSFENIQMRIKTAYETLARTNQDCYEALKNKLSDPKQADGIHKDNGYKLIRKQAKSIGLVIPKTGGNEHFVLTKDMLVLLVSTTLVPDESLTIESFLEDLSSRWGMVFDEDGFTEVNRCSELSQRITDSSILEWFVEMLDDCGYYFALSDAISLVKNTNIAVEK